MRYTPENTVEIGIRADVWLNGDLQTHVYEADTDEGYIIRAKLDGEGKMFTEDGETVATERVEGVVTVETRFG